MQDYSGPSDHYPEGDLILGGVPFDIPVGGNNVWASGAQPGPGPRTIDIDVGVFGVTKVHTLINTWWGQPGPNSYASLEFFGSDGAYFKKDLIGNDDIRDHRRTIYTQTINDTTTVNVFTYDNGVDQVRLDKQLIVLPADFRHQTLVTIRASDNGNDNFQRMFLAGVTLETKYRIVSMSVQEIDLPPETPGE